MKGLKAVVCAFALCLLASVPAWAGGSVAEIRKQAEASMPVIGYVFIAPDGSVDQIEIDEAEKIPLGIRNLIGMAQTSWRFDPVLIDGTPKRVKARMSLRVVARKLDSGDYQLDLRSAYFGVAALEGKERDAAEAQDVSSVRGRSLQPPRYPEVAAAKGAKGTVILMLKIGRDGKSQESFAEQVNLRVVARTETEMEDLRTVFAKSAMAASRRWVFDIPTEGEDADAAFWTVRIPVDYRMFGDPDMKHGQWEAYIPGPRQKAPWILEDIEWEAPDALIAGGVYQVGKGLRLLTPLQPG